MSESDWASSILLAGEVTFFNNVHENRWSSCYGLILVSADQSGVSPRHRSQYMCSNCDEEERRPRTLEDSGGLYLGLCSQTPEAEAAGGQHLESFCWILLPLAAADRHCRTEGDVQRFHNYKCDFNWTFHTVRCKWGVRFLRASVWHLNRFKHGAHENRARRKQSLWTWCNWKATSPMSGKWSRWRRTSALRAHGSACDVHILTLCTNDVCKYRHLPCSYIQLLHTCTLRRRG